MARQRRMKGEGSITKLPSGKYRVRLEVAPSPLGKRQWLTALVGTQKEATSKLQEFQKEKTRETSIEKLKTSFSDYIEPYMAYKKAEGLLPSSLYRLEQHLLKASKDFFEYVPVQKITGDFLQTVIEQWRQDGNIESSIKIKYNILQGFFDWLKQKKTISKNPCDDVVLKRQKKMKHKKLLTISQEEHKKLKEVMMKEWNPEDTSLSLKSRFLAIYLLAYETGMREGEIAGLRVKNIDIDTATITVQSNLTIVRGELIDNPPKTEAGYREIVISQSTLGYLKELLKGKDKEDYVFVSAKGRAYNPPTLLTVFKKFQKEAGIDHNIKFHSIRHTNASIMIDKNVPTPVITERLGHSSVAITYNTYAHALRDSEERKKPLVEA